MTNQIPISFLMRLTTLSWREASYGYGRGWLGWKSVVELAVRLFEQGSDRCSEELAELAGLGKETAWKAGELVVALAALEPERPEETVSKKWLFIRLSWLYERRKEVDDPLGEVEKICADFSYPPETLGFIRFMPPLNGYQPEQHSPEENRARLFRLWRSFLDQQQKLFPPSAP